MPNLNRLRITWNGTALVGQGLTTLLYDGSGATKPDVAKVLAAFGRLPTVLPSGLTITVPNTGDVIDSASGQLVTTWTNGTGGTVSGSSAGAAPAGVGACVTWNTGGILNGRRLRGRTFLAPLTYLAYGTDGTLDNQVVTTLQGFASDIMASGPLVVWHRPTKAAPGTGGWGLVTTATVHDRVAVLRSRRY